MGKKMQARTMVAIFAKSAKEVIDSLVFALKNIADADITEGGRKSKGSFPARGGTRVYVRAHSRRIRQNRALGARRKSGMRQTL